MLKVQNVDLNGDAISILALRFGKGLNLEYDACSYSLSFFSFIQVLTRGEIGS